MPPPIQRYLLLVWRYQQILRPNLLQLHRSGACRVETWRGGNACSVSTSRSSNRTGGFPASGSRRRSCHGPREAGLTHAEVDQPQLLMQVLIGEPGGCPSWHLVLLAQPLTQPGAHMLFHGAIGFG